MKRLFVMTVLCFVTIFSAAGLASAGQVRYAGHVRLARTSCCGFNQVVFKVFGRSDVRYRVCVRKPSGRKSCKDGVTGESGDPSSKQFISSAVGTYSVTWKVNGHIVDRSSWINTAEGV